MSTSAKGTIHPAPYVKAVTASANPLDPRPVSLLITVAGTITIENRDGTSVADMVVSAGQELHIQPYKITAITDAVVVGLYATEE